MLFLGGMHRVTWPSRVKKLPLAAGIVVAFGSLWLTCKNQLYLTNSNGSFLWDYFVPGFLKSDRESLPEKQPRGLQPSRKLPHSEIRKNERVVSVNLGPVSYFETNNLASNEPIEDRNTEYLVNNNSIIFGVFDGHSGWQCAEEVMKRLPHYVALSMACAKQDLSNKNIENLYSKVKHLQETNDNREDMYGATAKEFYEATKQTCAENTSIERQLKNAYQLLDEDIVNEAMPSVNGYAIDEMMKGLSGACAITAFIQNNELYVANSGDCRAVLGSKAANGKWHTISLSTDQNAANSEEVKRVKLKHPAENFVVSNDRLLGMLQPFRAFGDVMFKWDYHLHEEVLNVVFKRVVIPANLYSTPPYLTAEPVVTHHTLETGDHFLIIATDGLWEMISSENAVQCIGDLIDEGLLEMPARDTGVQQTNGASQLIQEALGGNDEVKVSTLLTAPRHIRRAVRDDITVTVVYFTQPVN